MVTVERSDGSTVRLSKEENDRERRESLEGHRKAQDLADGDLAPTSPPGVTDVSRTEPTPKLSPEDLDKAAEAALLGRDGGQDRAQETQKNNAGAVRRCPA